jgi:hypothetical protein
MFFPERDQEEGAALYLTLRNEKKRGTIFMTTQEVPCCGGK